LGIVRVQAGLLLISRVDASLKKIYIYVYYEIFSEKYIRIFHFSE